MIFDFQSQKVVAKSEFLKKKKQKNFYKENSKVTKKNSKSFLNYLVVDILVVGILVVVDILVVQVEVLVGLVVRCMLEVDRKTFCGF